MSCCNRARAVARRSACLLFLGLCLGACSLGPARRSVASTQYPQQTRLGLEQLFAQYPAGERWSGARPPLIVDARLNRWAETRLREGYRGRANFAGHYEIVRWGCGTNCVSGAVIDLRSGRFVTLIPTCEWGLEFRTASALFVENPPAEQASENAARPAWARPQYHRWDGRRFVHLAGNQPP